MNRLVCVGFLMLCCGACRQQKRVEREVEIELNELDKQRQMEAYRRSPEYKKKVMKKLNGQMPTKKDWDDLKVP